MVNFFAFFFQQIFTSVPTKTVCQDAKSHRKTWISSWFKFQSSCLFQHSIRRERWNCSLRVPCRVFESRTLLGWYCDFVHITLFTYSFPSFWKLWKVKLHHLTRQGSISQPSVAKLAEYFLCFETAHLIKTAVSRPNSMFQKKEFWDPSLKDPL